MKKRTFYTEAAYVVGLISVALGVTFMTKADFGVSMVVAPAYIIYLKLSQYFGFFTFGMAEYALQAVLLTAMAAVIRKFKLSYLFSFVTAVVYGFILDGCMLLAAPLDGTSLPVRAALYVCGMLLSSLGVSMMFHTYIAPEVYELFVKEVSGKFGVDINRFKTGYDCVSCGVSVILSFCFFGLFHFEGVKLGTIFCALVNGKIIGFISSRLEKRFDFRDGLPLRKFF